MEKEILGIKAPRWSCAIFAVLCLRPDFGKKRNNKAFRSSLCDCFNIPDNFILESFFNDPNIDDLTPETEINDQISIQLSEIDKAISKYLTELKEDLEKLPFEKSILFSDKGALGYGFPSIKNPGGFPKQYNNIIRVSFSGDNMHRYISKDTLPDSFKDRWRIKIINENTDIDNL